MAVISKDLGPITAYAAAVNRGYTGTREEFETLMASYATVAEQAGESAESAEESAASAAQSAASASQSAQNAEGSRYNALLYSNQANGYKNTANTAAQAAEDARDAAQSAQTAAEAAQEGAETAVEGFDSAVTQAISDVNAAGTNQKELAKRQAEKSEAWAVGQISGEDVGVSDPAYHNNAKYYAESAGTSATTATTKASEAAQSASGAAASASAAAASAQSLVIDGTLSQEGQAADAEAVGNNLNIARSSAVELNPIAYYRHSSDGLSVVDFAEMPLNSYDFAQFSVFKDALLSANFPLLWDDTDYIAIERRAVGGKSSDVSVINLHNFTKKRKLEMLYLGNSTLNKYRWILPSTDFTKQYLPADAKAVGDALAQKADISSLIVGRSNNVAVVPWGGVAKSDIGDTIDFRTLPLNTYCYTQYSYLKQSLLDTNMPDSDWEDNDYISIFRSAVSKYQGAGVSTFSFYNFAKTRKLEMLYLGNSTLDKYKWILPSTDFTKQYLPADAKAVGDALAQKADISSLIVGRSNNVAVVPWGGVAKSDIGDTIDFRTLPLNTYCYTQYSYLKQSLLDTNMPDSDWEDNDYISIFRSAVSKYQGAGVSTFSFYNFTKTRKLEMLYLGNSTLDKYKWLTQGVIQNINNDYIYNQYSNSYEITAYPAITSDTNNYLASTDDNTDRTADIVTLLSQTGVCNLGSGVFYVSGIDMPNDSTISGSGSATKIVLLDSVTDGYAIKMGSRCIVKNCTIVGGAGTYSPTSTIGTRYGIVWIGTATPESIISPGPTRGTISNCYIYNFSGSGIYCQGTGTGTSNCLNVVNVYIYYCTVGIYIPLLSEFHRFTNVDCRGCYYGTINNGGNNVFANCGFSKNIIGIMIDAKSNSAHGTYSGCVINHSGSNNDGIAIKLINISPKEIFTGCQIYYGSVDIENCKGIVFNACNFGSDIPINITDGKTVLFSSCVFTSQPVITKVNNIYTHFADCYTREDDIVTV